MDWNDKLNAELGAIRQGEHLQAQQPTLDLLRSLEDAEDDANAEMVRANEADYDRHSEMQRIYSNLEDIITDLEMERFDAALKAARRLFNTLED